MRTDATAPPAPPARLLARERYLILASLLVLAAGGWAVVLWQAHAASDSMGLTMGLRAPLFLGMWTAMMVAMMFPSAAPMLLTFASIQAAKRQRGQAFVPTWLFALAYLAVWVAFGALAYALAVGADRLAERSMFVMEHAARVGGLTLIAAGAYQLSPLKHVCLAKCRTPRQFVLTSWRDGRGGALRMGVTHGLYCLGCCWLLFVLLVPLGIMNVAAMLLLTALIFAEKVLPHARQLAIASGMVLVAWGLLVLVHPAALPTMM